MRTVRGFPPQHQDRQPGLQSAMVPEPREVDPAYRGAARLRGRVALITGGDSGIGRAVAVLFAREGADISIVYLDEHRDAGAARDLVEAEGSRCMLTAGDVSDPVFCRHVVEATAREYGRLDILVNNAAIQHFRPDIESLSDGALDESYRINVFSCFYLAREAVRHLPDGGCIINSASVTAYRGTTHALEYASTKGAIVSFTRSLALMLAPRGIRVNAVAPGPVWTPLIPSSFPAELVRTFGERTPMGRAAQPCEIAPSYVFLASRESLFITGQVLHPNGGEIVNT